MYIHAYIHIYIYIYDRQVAAEASIFAAPLLTLPRRKLVPASWNIFIFVYIYVSVYTYILI